MANVMTDMYNSINALRTATPIIKKLLHFANGEIIDVENQDNETCFHLDANCGIDYLLYFKGEGWTRGAAWRSQPVKQPYDTFTVRKSRDSGSMTEYQKRKDAIENNAIYPYYTLQAYYDENTGELLSLGITKTEDLINCISEGCCKVLHTRSDKIGQAEFYVVPWSELQRLNYSFINWTKE